MAVGNEIVDGFVEVFGGDVVLLLAEAVGATGWCTSPDTEKIIPPLLSHGDVESQRLHSTAHVEVSKTWWVAGICPRRV